MKTRVAVVGSGISGLAAAWSLATEAQVTLFEAAGHFGGHANTVDVCLEGLSGPVDTGFLVFNHRTYPRLVKLFEELGVETADSDMSFSVQDRSSGLEWSGSNLNSVFAQRSNLLKPSFIGMLRDILRFNRLTTALAQRGEEEILREPVGEFLERHRFGVGFREGYLLPMVGCIWSCPTRQMLQFPIATLIRFCHNHGLLQIADRPQWRTVRSGSRNYVQRMVRAVEDRRLNCPVRQVRRMSDASGMRYVTVATDRGEERFDEVVLACHSDQTLALLPDADPMLRAWLAALRYHRNRAVLHTDATQMPRRRLAWAAWNYERAADVQTEGSGVCLHYWINKLQPLPWKTPVVVSLNPIREPLRRSVLQEFEYEHPVFDLTAIQAQSRLEQFQGQDGLWFCGAWTRYGFHEDGLTSGLAVATELRSRLGQGSLSPAPLRQAA